MFVICVILAALLFGWLINYYSDSYRANSLRAFHRLETEMDGYIENIDSFIDVLYQEPLLTDFLNFFDHSIGEYFTRRLSYTEAQRTPSFIEECKNFVANNRYVISEIRLCPNGRTNIIHFADGSAPSYELNLPSSEVTPLPIQSFEYLYTRDLMDPSNLTQKQGEIQFVIDLSQLFQLLDSYNLEYAYIIDQNQTVKYSQSLEEANLFHLAVAISQNESGQGNIANGGGLNNVYYNVYHFPNYSFSLVTLIDSGRIFHQNATAFLLIGVLILILYFSISLLLALRMHHDTKEIRAILDIIENAKNGDFQKVSYQATRHDEYDMIALSLSDMAQKISDFIQHEYLLKLNQQRAEMIALENQIDPHFLYNTLEIIRSKAYLNGDSVVAGAIYNLGSLYRDIVKSDHIITVEEELQILTRYLKLMEFKYSDNFFYQINVPQEIRRLDTVKFWMQPIVENFFTHGFHKNEPYNVLLILGEEHESDYTLEFIDNGEHLSDEALAAINAKFSSSQMDEENTSSIGLRNVYLRLHYLYGEDVSMCVRNNDQTGVIVQVTIKKGECNHV